MNKREAASEADAEAARPVSGADNACYYRRDAEGNYIASVACAAAKRDVAGLAAPNVSFLHLCDETEEMLIYLACLLLPPHG